MKALVYDRQACTAAADFGSSVSDTSIQAGAVDAA
jgi:hypothetical protein